MEFSFPGGDFFPVGKCEEGRHSELRSPFPLLALLPSGHAAVIRCGMEDAIDRVVYASLSIMIRCADVDNCDTLFCFFAFLTLYKCQQLISF